MRGGLRQAATGQKGTLTVPLLRGSPWRRKYPITCYEWFPADIGAMDLALLAIGSFGRDGIN